MPLLPSAQSFSLATSLYSTVTLVFAVSEQCKPEQSCLKLKSFNDNTDQL